MLLARVYYVISDASHLRKTISETSEYLEESLVFDMPDFEMSEVMEEQIKRISKKLKTDCHLFPYKLFLINNEAFLAIITIALTYLVVLLQLKTAELPLE